MELGLTPTIYDFSGALDGSGPVGGVTIKDRWKSVRNNDSGGAYGEGVVWEIAR